jgi:hypothetical protein
MVLVNGKVTRDCPFGPANAFGGLIKFGSHVKIAYLRLAAIDGVKDNQRVDFKVGKVKIDVDAIKTDNKVD